MPVLRFGLILPAVVLPAGESGNLVLCYWPDSILRGLELVTLTAVAIAAASVWKKWARPHGVGGAKKEEMAC